MRSSSDTDLGSMARAGNQFCALDAATGAILWRHAAGASVNAGPAVARGSVYWGSRYERGGGSAGNELYAFAVDGR